MRSEGFMPKIDIIEMIDLLDKHDASFMFPGHFNISTNSMKIAFTDYVKTGKSTAFDELILMYKCGLDATMWNLNSCFNWMSEEEFNTIHRIFNDEGFWKASHSHNDNEIQNILDWASYCRDQTIREATQEHRRQKADSFISNKKTRKAIFNRDGEICAACGSTDNLSLDHITAVNNGGEDTLENLQVLCTSCNSIKGDKCLPLKTLKRMVKKRKEKAEAKNGKA